eukprot:GDKJ01002277.1.p1 GENE.GDKJ01002277.1~~GDKJ01002277.1.p1  ORF type:complete len:497 (-),score=180.52 GDKJ01002277.1:133-1623(-)
MSDPTFAVRVRVYDLSRGMAKNMSKMMLGKQIDGIWHTGIEVFGLEYFFGSGGIMKAPPHVVEAEYGMQPVDVIPLGETSIPQDIFDEFVKECENGNFHGSKYNIIENNCNNFSDECAQFLTGAGIPHHIVSLPKEIMATPFGQMLFPMLSSMSTPGSQASSNVSRAVPNTPSPSTAADAGSSPLAPLHAALTEVRIADSSLETRELCLSTISKLLANFISDPSNEKFASVSISVPAIQKRICSIPAGATALDAAGFKKQSDGVTFRISSSSLSSSDMKFLRDAKALVDKHLDFLKNPLGPAPSPPQSTPSNNNNTTTTNSAGSSNVQSSIAGLLSSLASPPGSGDAAAMSNPLATLQNIVADRNFRNQAMTALQTNPDLAQMAQTLASSLSNNANQSQSTNSSSAADNQQRLDFSSLLNAHIQGASHLPPQAPPARQTVQTGANKPSQQQQNATRSLEVNALLGMGFSDEVAIRAALEATGGNMSEAVGILSKHA